MDKRLAAALECTHIATRICQEHFNHATVRFKEDGTQVTEADVAIEKEIREFIHTLFPADAILGEELGNSSLHELEDGWIIDPIDGTRLFALGIPLFGTLISYLEQGHPVMGVVHFPQLGQTIHGAKDLGCWLQEGDQRRQIRVDQKIQSLGQAVISASGVHGSDIFLDNGTVPYRLSEVIHRSKQFQIATDCFQHMLVARGKLHGAIDTLMKPWDIAALIPCIEEAGGVYANIQGKRDDILHGGSLITAATPELLAELIEVLQPQ
ncbi:inositol monophosphatase family protein [Dongshaea marina]|uniref:inositol monophosphatase family protein n=1 Tax=Dongshaea marina TaxID=2047966 RepID=UPI00131F33A2|nr:inositol monophosphatase family protein [Dongshaea marina]